MKYYLALALLVATLLAAGKVEAQITSNVYERVLNVRVNAGTKNEGTATAFTLDVDGREYLITAKHVVAGLKEKDKLDVFMDGAWKPLIVTIFRCDDPTDIAVLVPPYQLTINFDLPFESNSFFFGQDAFFLGFPYGLQSSLSANGPYPMAIIKRGTISGTRGSDDSHKADQILLDGYNNPGFSGGPIVYKDLNQGGVNLQLIAVVSGFLPDVVPVMKEHDIPSPSEAGDVAKSQPWRIKKRANGSYFEYVDNSTYVALNTGIVVGFTIGPAVALIRKHPVGPVAGDLPGNQPIK